MAEPIVKVTSLPLPLIVHQALIKQNEKLEAILKSQAAILERLSLQIPEPEWLGSLKQSIDKLGSTMTAIVRPKNPSSIEVHQLVLESASIAQRFPVLLMPWDHSVVIKALSTNAGTIYIAGSKQDAEDTSRSYPLNPGETIEYKINELSVLWAAASVAGEGLIWTTEAEVG